MIQKVKCVKPDLSKGAIVIDGAIIGPIINGIMYHSTLLDKNFTNETEAKKAERQEEFRKAVHEALCLDCWPAGKEMKPRDMTDAIIKNEDKLRKIFANKKLNINIVFKDIPKGLRGINAKLSVEKEEKEEKEELPSKTQFKYTIHLS